MAATAEERRYAAKVSRRLQRAYPEAACSLDYRTPLELLVATVLSAQCTDERVNLVTRELFVKYHGPDDYARVELPELENDIRSTGFFRNKAKSIKECCRTLAESHGSRVPESIEELVELPGIGRKTANVILGNAFGVASGVVVDTHVGRISRRLGLSAQKNPGKVEEDLMGLFPKKEWIVLSHRMIGHGRLVCTARSPKCDDCPLADICPRIGVESS